MPRVPLPAGSSFETGRDGTSRFDVTVAMPLIGLIAAYRVWLEPDA